MGLTGFEADRLTLKRAADFNSLNAKCIHTCSHNNIIIRMMHVSVVFITKNRFEYHVVHLHTCNSVTCM